MFEALILCFIVFHSYKMIYVCACLGTINQFNRKNVQKKRLAPGTSLVVQWLELCASTAGGIGSIPGVGN